MKPEPEDARLDAWLDSYRVAPPSTDLVERIVAASPARARGGRWVLPRWLWPGAGFAGIGLAGSLAGALAVSAALRATSLDGTDWPERATAFTEAAADWSEE
jgi:hypothetical protein